MNYALLRDPTESEHAAHDVAARIARLFVYPVKSCAGIELRESPLHETGLAHDRAFMVVDDAGRFVSQRDLPRMALIRPGFESDDCLLLRAPDMRPLRVPLSGAMDAIDAPRRRVEVWDDALYAFDMGDAPARWFSEFLGAATLDDRTPRSLRLVRFDPQERRLSNRRWTGDVDAPNQFADAFALLVLSEASLAGLNDRLLARGHDAVGIERFRPNLVLAGIDAHDEDRLDTLSIDTDAGTAALRLVKPCVRCPIPNIDPATAQSAFEVGDELQRYRRSDTMGGGVTFGINAIVLGGAGRTLRVGQAVAADWRFD